MWLRFPLNMINLLKTTCYNTIYNVHNVMYWGGEYQDKLTGIFFKIYTFIEVTVAADRIGTVIIQEYVLLVRINILCSFI